MPAKKKYKIHNFEQHSEEWFNIRLGRMTASNAVAIGNNGTGLDTYCYKLAAEILTGKSVEIKNIEAMDRGNEIEPDARATFEFEKNIDVKQIGFASYGDYAGCSPDGLIDNDGLIEIKCPLNNNYVKLLAGGNIESKYIWQMQMQMAILERSYCYFVAYNPNFKRSLFTKKINADTVKIDAIFKGLEIGEAKIKEILKKTEVVNE